jgi:hypothetical protein
MGASALPRREQLLDVAALLLGEIETGDEAPRLCWVVVLDRGLEMLAQRSGLRELASEPAEQAHLGGLDCHMGGDGLEPPTSCV